MGQPPGALQKLVQKQSSIHPQNALAKTFLRPGLCLQSLALMETRRTPFHTAFAPSAGHELQLLHHWQYSTHRALQRFVSAILAFLRAKQAD